MLRLPHHVDIGVALVDRRVEGNTRRDQHSNTGHAAGAVARVAGDIPDRLVARCQIVTFRPGAIARIGRGVRSAAAVRIGGAEHMGQAREATLAAGIVQVVGAEIEGRIARCEDAVGRHGCDRRRGRAFLRACSAERGAISASATTQLVSIFPRTATPPTDKN